MPVNAYFKLADSRGNLDDAVNDLTEDAHTELSDLISDFSTRHTREEAANISRTYEDNMFTLLHELYEIPLKREDRGLYLGLTHSQRCGLLQQGKASSIP